MATHSKQWWSRKTGYHVDEIPDTVTFINTGPKVTQADIDKVMEIARNYKFRI